ncbi:hypothetical protein BLOT_007350 [Blomia tropicalis]|nr:hypothetical protein BLOT_007350 [Blomia tropicalis]
MAKTKKIPLLIACRIECGSSHTSLDHELASPISLGKWHLGHTYGSIAPKPFTSFNWSNTAKFGNQLIRDLNLISIETSIVDYIGPDSNEHLSVGDVAICHHNIITVFAGLTTVHVVPHWKQVHNWIYLNFDHSC